MAATKTDGVLNLGRAKIMIVDDDPELRMALKLRLRANHYETVSACDGPSRTSCCWPLVPSTAALRSRRKWRMDRTRPSCSR